MDRGTGRTTKQMKDAPYGSLYGVSPGHDIYALCLSYSIGRKDLQVFVLRNDTDMYRFRGSDRHIVVDHHVAETLSPQLMDCVRIHNDAVERRK